MVPADHFYRPLERSLDLSFVRNLVRGAYVGKGRPSVDPAVFSRCRYALDEALPDHSRPTRIRQQLGIEVCEEF